MKIPVLKNTVCLLFLTFSLSAFSVCEARETVITFMDQAALDAAFPESLRTLDFKNHKPVLSILEDPKRVSLFTGTREYSSESAKGRLTLRSAETFSKDLNFLSGGGLRITFDRVFLDYPMKATGYNGRFGIGNSSSGGIDQDNAIYFEINRQTNTFSLIVSHAGVPTTLASWTQVEDGQKDIFPIDKSINSIFIQTLVLTVSATAWNVEVTFMNKRNEGAAVTRTMSGSFDPAWTEETWGSSTFLVLESNETQTATDGDARWCDLQVQSITFEPLR